MSPTSVDAPWFLFHVAKTGGVSIAYSVAHALGSGAVLEFEDVEPTRVRKRIDRIVRTRPQFRLMHGHLSPVNLALDAPVRRATMLRTPLDRLMSHFCYVHLHRHRGIHQANFFLQPDKIGRNQFGAQDLVEWVERFGWDNLQVRVISGKAKGPVDQGDIERCIGVLESMDLVGITSEIDTFVARLGIEICGKPFDARHENSSNRSILTINDEEAREISLRLLQADTILYEHAKRIAFAPHVQVSSRLPTDLKPKRLGLGALLVRYLTKTPREYYRHMRRGVGVVLRAVREIGIRCARAVALN